MPLKPGITSLFLSLVFLPLVLSACSGKEKPAPPGMSGDISRAAEAGAGFHIPPAWRERYLLKTGENPLWFEFGLGGPALIESPGHASLAPFVPWPYARFSAGMQIWDGFLVIAVNGDGFLVLGDGRPLLGENNAPAAKPAAENTAAESAPEESVPVFLYHAGGVFLKPYTATSFFSWDGKPAVLFYRNDFFAEPAAPPLRPQVYVLDKSSPVPLPARVPALEDFPDSGEWEAEIVRRGSDGFWYYRVKEKGAARNKTAYFRAEDLAGKGEEISVGEWRDSNLPEAPENIPPCLADILYTTHAALELDEVPAVQVISPEFPETRLITAGSGLSGGDSLAAPLAGYCDGARSVALVILPGGRGLYSAGKGASLFSLPPLPENYVYTGVALAGNALIATWEEQWEAGVGAAGFMVKTFFVPGA